MAWHKKASGATNAKPATKPKAPTVQKPVAPTVPKPTAAKQGAPAAAKPGAHHGKTGVYAEKKPHFAPKHTQVKNGPFH